MAFNVRCLVRLASRACYRNGGGFDLHLSRCRARQIVKCPTEPRVPICRMP